MTAAPSEPGRGPGGPTASRARAITAAQNDLEEVGLSA